MNPAVAAARAAAFLAALPAVPTPAAWVDVWVWYPPNGDTVAGIGASPDDARAHAFTDYALQHDAEDFGVPFGDVVDEIARGEAALLRLPATPAAAYTVAELTTHTDVGHLVEVVDRATRRRGAR